MTDTDFETLVTVAARRDGTTEDHDADPIPLPNGAAAPARVLTDGGCGTCTHMVLADGDCQECRNTGLAGPYPDCMGDQMEALGGQSVDAHPDDAITGFVIPCPYCRPDAYPAGFPGLTGPLGTYLIASTT